MKAFERSIAKAHPKLLLRFSVALGFAALTGVCSNLSFHLGFTPVPVTLQVFAVILSGMVLGSRWGAICQLQYLSMGLMGIPVFAGISSGPLVFLGPTGGYLIGFVLGAFACGYAFERLNEKAPLTPFIAGAAGIATIYMFGTPWLAMWLKLTGKPFSDCLSGAWQLGVVPFIGIDILKTAAASSMALGGRSWHGMIEPFKNIGW